MKIADNLLLLGTIVAAATYWTVGLLVPWTPFAAVVNVALVVGSGLLFLRFAPDAGAILFKGRRNEDAPDGDGSHLAVYGTTLIALGGVVTAIAAFMMGFPATRELVFQTPAALFGRSIASAGFLLVFLSPSVTRKGIQFSGGLWVYAVAAVIILAVYALGYNAGFQSEHPSASVIENTDHIPADRPQCDPVERTVWGTDQKTYHMPDSVHRRQVIPTRCFASPDEAEENGFRRVG